MVASTGTRTATSWSVARNSSLPPSAAIWTPDIAWTALRVDATRVAVWSSVNSSWDEVSIFTMWLPLQKERAVRGVHLFTAPETPAACEKAMNRSWACKRRSLSVAAVVMDPFGQRPNRFGCLGVRGDTLCGALAGMQHGGVVAAAEGAADGGEALPCVLAREVHGDLARPGDPRRAAVGQ